MKKKIKEYMKNHKKLRILSITIISVLSLFLIINLGRYVKKIYEDYITRTQVFYFNSDKLTTDNKEFEINYWSGIDSYPILITVNSLDNNLRGTNIPINYTITCVPDQDMACDLSQNGGTIGTLTHKDSFTVTARPERNFNIGERVSIRVKAKASLPYEKELSAVFTFVVGKYELSYKIEDQTGQPYLESVISNPVDYYIVRTPFGNYSQNEEISSSVYESLSAEDKAKCSSARITLSFDPHNFRLDMTNYYYQHKISETITQIDGYNYVNSFTFDINAQTAVSIKFYKIHTENDYTYPITNNTTAINFTAS